MNSHLKFSLIVLLLSLLISCEEQKHDTSKILFDPAFAKELMKKSNDTITLGSITYQLEAELNLGIMQAAKSEGTTLTSTNCLYSQGNVVIPLSVDLVKQYVIMGDSIWISLYEEEKGDIDSTRVEFCRTSINGPYWSAGTVVDIVAEGFDNGNDTIFFINVEDQVISSGNK